MFSGVLSALWSDLAIDLGTANTLVYAPRRGIVLDEPSVVAMVERDGYREILAVGQEARDMLGRTPENIITVRPLRDGVIADFVATEEMIKQFISRVVNRLSLATPRVMLCVPSSATQVERRAVYDAAHAAGARKIYLMEEPVAAAIGAGLQIKKPRGAMVVDIGGGTTDIAVLSLGGVIASHSFRTAGNAMDRAIINYIRRNHHLLIGEINAEYIKKEAGAALYKVNGSKVDIQIKGRNLRTGLPSEITLGPPDITDALAPTIEVIADEIRYTLEEMPPELAADISDRGIVLTGGGAQLQKLDQALSEKTGIPFHIPNDPLRCVAIGAGRALEHLDAMQDLLIMVD